MTEPSPASSAPHHAHVVVHPVQTDSTGPHRRVAILGAYVGKAYSLEDVAEFCRRAGLDVDAIDDSGLVEWQSGGPEVWE